MHSSALPHCPLERALPPDARWRQPLPLAPPSPRAALAALRLLLQQDPLFAHAALLPLRVPAVVAGNSLPASASMRLYGTWMWPSGQRQRSAAAPAQQLRCFPPPHGSRTVTAMHPLPTLNSCSEKQGRN